MRRGDLPGSPVVNNPPCSAGDTGSIPGGETKIPQALTKTRYNQMNKINKLKKNKMRRDSLHLIFICTIEFTYIQMYT